MAGVVKYEVMLIERGLGGGSRGCDLWSGSTPARLRRMAVRLFPSGPVHGPAVVVQAIRHGHPPPSLTHYNCQQVLVEKHGHWRESSSTHLSRSALYETTC